MNGPWVLLFLTIITAGGCAALAGHALAVSWRSARQVVGYVLLLTVADRFLSFALFQGALLSVAGFLLDGTILLAVALLSWRIARVGMMVRQYPWLYRRAGLFFWRET